MIRSIISKRGIGGLVAVVTLLFAFGTTAAIAQVENPSQISIQGTGLVTRDTGDPTSHSASKSGGFLLGYSYQFNNWAGVEGNYGYTRNTQNYIGLAGQSSLQSD